MGVKELLLCTVLFGGSLILALLLHPLELCRTVPQSQHLLHKRSVPETGRNLCGKRSAAFRPEFHRPTSLSGGSKLPDLYAVIPGMQLGLLHSVWLTSQLRVSFPVGIRLDRLSFAVPNSA